MGFVATETNEGIALCLAFSFFVSAASQQLQSSMEIRDFHQFQWESESHTGSFHSPISQSAEQE